jgi:phosphohistidine phosphatase
MPRIYLLRHGEAERQITTDAERKLTTKGRADLCAMAHAALQWVPGIDAVWVSPLVRAQQTWQEAQAVWRLSAPVTTEVCLIPEGDLDAMMTAWAASPSQSLCCVTHQPWVGLALHRLLGLEPDYYTLPTATLAVVDLPVKALGLGRLIHYWTPSP